MVDKLIKLVIGVVVIALLGWFLRWVMAELAVPHIFVVMVWIVFALLVLLAIVGLLGYGPFKDSLA